VNIATHVCAVCGGTVHITLHYTLQPQLTHDCTIGMSTRSNSDNRQELLL